MAETKECPKCEAVIGESEKICPKCETDIEEFENLAAAVDDVEKYRERKRKKEAPPEPTPEPKKSKLGRLASLGSLSRKKKVSE